jgi:hypothetical protein
MDSDLQRESVKNRGELSGGFPQSQEHSLLKTDAA